MLYIDINTPMWHVTISQPEKRRWNNSCYDNFTVALTTQRHKRMSLDIHGYYFHSISNSSCWHIDMDIDSPAYIPSSNPTNMTTSLLWGTDNIQSIVSPLFNFPKHATGTNGTSVINIIWKKWQLLWKCDIISYEYGQIIHRSSSITF